MGIVEFSVGVLLVNYYKIVTITMKLNPVTQFTNNELWDLFTYVLTFHSLLDRHLVWMSSVYSFCRLCWRTVQYMHVLWEKYVLIAGSGLNSSGTCYGLMGSDVMILTHRSSHDRSEYRVGLGQSNKSVIISSTMQLQPLSRDFSYFSYAVQVACNHGLYWVNPVDSITFLFISSQIPCYCISEVVNTPYPVSVVFTKPRLNMS